MQRDIEEEALEPEKRKIARQKARDEAAYTQKRDQAKQADEKTAKEKEARRIWLKNCGDEITAVKRESGIVDVDAIMVNFKGIERSEVETILRGAGGMCVDKEWLFIDAALSQELASFIEKEGRVGVANVSAFLFERLR
jgi:hypothetical protein